MAVTESTAHILECSESDYHADPCDSPSLSSSVATTLLTRSPKHAFLEHPKLGGLRRKPTKAMDAGSIIHAILLGTIEDSLTVLDFKDFRTDAAKEARGAVEAAGKTPVLAREMTTYELAADELRKSLAALGIELSGLSERTLIWQENSARGPVWCRGRPDHLLIDDRRALILDLKKITSAHPDKCARHMLDYGCDVQAAAYRSAVGKLRPDLLGRIDFVNLFCEIEPPHVVTPTRPNGQFRQLGELKWERAVDLWSLCLQTNTWPAYADRIIELEPPPWALAKEMGEVA